MENSLKILLIVLIFSHVFDAHADGATDVMCSSIRYIHGMGVPMITMVIIGVNLLAIFGRVP
ncbi:hypothetical protein [Wolbachia endosymbiont of Mansonella perstans]|uniref:hypothetical protein n=1 Tax=Wolbachia endosymbiont of Mansonella perstans TaxID=229526 RepID=UPI0034CED724|nr:hypothetical protein [Wolbachia endosymbiont of Mansonella perstans]